MIPPLSTLTSPAGLAGIGAGVLLLLLLAMVIRLEVKVRRLVRGKDAKSLEDSIRAIGKGQEEIERFRRDIERYLTELEARVRRSLQGVETVRFNPFKGSGEGGNQSFAIALLNEEGDGVVLSSIYSRERMSVFAKPVKAHASGHPLSAEEERALTRAKEKLGKGE